MEGSRRFVIPLTHLLGMGRTDDFVVLGEWEEEDASVKTALMPCNPRRAVRKPVRLMSNNSRQTDFILVTEPVHLVSNNSRQTDFVLVRSTVDGELQMLCSNNQHRSSFVLVGLQPTVAAVPPHKRGCNRYLHVKTKKGGGRKLIVGRRVKVLRRRGRKFKPVKRPSPAANWAFCSTWEPAKSLGCPRPTREPNPKRIKIRDSPAALSPKTRYERAERVSNDSVIGFL